MVRRSTPFFRSPRWRSASTFVNQFLAATAELEAGTVALSRPLRRARHLHPRMRRTLRRELAWLRRECRFWRQVSQDPDALKLWGSHGLQAIRRTIFYVAALEQQIMASSRRPAEPREG